MRAGGYAAVLFLVAVAGWHGPAGGADTGSARTGRSAETKPPSSSRCMARCVEMEAKCEEYEKASPSCATVDICYEEKLQCETLCRVTAQLKFPACS